jgi:hypothetical protein
VSWREVREFSVEVATDTFRGTYQVTAANEAFAAIAAVAEFRLMRPNEPLAGLRVEVL